MDRTARPRLAGAGIFLAAVGILLAAVAPTGRAQAAAGGKPASGCAEGLPAGQRSWTAVRAPVPADAATDPEVSLIGVACASAAACVAGGQYRDSSGNAEVLLVTGHGSSWTAARAPLPPGAAPHAGAAILSVACAPAAVCAAVGYYTDTQGNGHGLLLTGHGISWTAASAPFPPGADAHPQVYLDGVACPSASKCVAVGWYSDTRGDDQGLLLSWDGASWTAAKAPLPAGAAPGADLNGVACPTASVCEAVGNYVTTAGRPQGVVLTGHGSSWTATTTPRPAVAPTSYTPYLQAIACWSASTCAITGSYRNWEDSPYPHLLMVTGHRASWTAVRAPLPTRADTYRYTEPELDGVACRSALSCVAVGTYQSPSTMNVLLLTGYGKSWTDIKAPVPPGAGPGPLPYPGPSVACPTAANCLAVGTYPADIPGFPYQPLNGLLLTGHRSTWTAAQAPFPPGGATSPGVNLEGVACPSTSACVAAGEYIGVAGDHQGMILAGPA